MNTSNYLKPVTTDATEQLIKDASEFVNGKIVHQSLIVLYGLGNQGKTNTLTDLLFLLTAPDIKIFVNKNFIRVNRRKVKHYKDGYYVLSYEEKNVFISTYGDGRKECERNKDFFEGKKIDEPIYVIDGPHIIELNEMTETEQQSRYYNNKPDFLISACRTEGGGVDATMYLADKLLPNVLQQVWIRKFGIKDGQSPDYIDSTYPIITKNDDKMAHDIKGFIDRVKDNKHYV